jgi:hypothetical protein
MTPRPGTSCPHGNYFGRVPADAGCIGSVGHHITYNSGRTQILTSNPTSFLPLLSERAASGFTTSARSSSTTSMSSTSSSRSTTGSDASSSSSRTSSSVSLTSTTSSTQSTLITSLTSGTANPVAWAGSIEPSQTQYCWSITRVTSTSDGEVVRVSQTSTYVPCASTASVATNTSSILPPLTSATSYSPNSRAHPPAFFAYVSVGAGAGIVLLTVIGCWLWWYRVGRGKEPFRKSRKKGGDMGEILGGDPKPVSDVATDPQVKSQIEELQIGQERIVQMVQAQLLEKMPGLDGITFRNWNKQVEEQHEIDEKKAEDARLAAIGGAYATTSRRIANAVVQQRIARGIAASIPQSKEHLDESGTQFLLRSEIGGADNRTLVPGDSASGLDWITSGQYEETNARFDRSPRDPRPMKAAYENIHELDNPDQFGDLVDEAVRWADHEHQQWRGEQQSPDSRRENPRSYEDPSTSASQQNQLPFQASMPGPSRQPRAANTDEHQQQQRDLPRSGTPRANNSGTENLAYRSPTRYSPRENPRYRSRSRCRTPTPRPSVAAPSPSRNSPRPRLSPLQTGLANTSYNGMSSNRTGSSADTPKRSPSLKRHHEVHTSTSDLVGPDGGIERHTTTTTYTRETTPVQENFPDEDDDISSLGPIQFARSELSYPYSTNESRLSTDPFEAEVKQNLAQIRLEKERAAEERRSQEEERARWRRKRDNLPPEYGERGRSTTLMRSPSHTRGTTPELEVVGRSSSKASAPGSAQKRRRQ